MHAETDAESIAVRSTDKVNANALLVGKRQSRNSNCSEFGQPQQASCILLFGSADKQSYSNLHHGLLILQPCYNSAGQQHTDLQQNLDLAVPAVIPTQASHTGEDRCSNARAHIFWLTGSRPVAIAP